MIVRCAICSVPFVEEDEVQGVMRAYWHQLPSRVTLSFSPPHDIEVMSLAHVTCSEGAQR